MKIIEKKTVDLIPYGSNPRNNGAAVEAVAASIREFGFKVPIIIDKKNVIVAGHTRLLAAIRLGMEEVPCIIADDLTEEQVRAFRLADNKTAELATWNDELLLQELKELQDIDMEQFGFDLSEFEEEKDIEEVDFEETEKEEPTAKTGQIWKLGEHRLMCGDSTKTEDVQKLMDGAVADLVITDPPYNVALGQHMRPSELKQLNRRTDGLVIDNDEFKNERDYVDFLNRCFGNILQSLKAGGAFYIWYAASKGESVFDALRESRMTAREQLIWVKSIFVMGRQDYHWRHEPCIYGWKDGAAHYYINDRTQDTIWDETPNLDKLKKEELLELLKSIYDRSTIIYDNKPSKSELHPTMKPVSLFAKLIKNSSRQGEIVLDIFGGSGTTMMACEQIGRKAYLMECDPFYADVIIKRWEEYTGQKAELLP